MHKTISALILFSIWSLSLKSQDHFIDTRDNQEYPVIKMGDHIWMGKNLNYRSDSSYCYNNEPENCERYGRLYEWEAALKACPEGWHLATEYEWQELEKFLGMDERELENQLNRGIGAADRLKPNGDLRFNEQFGGWGGSDDGMFIALDTIGTYWTSGEVNLERAWHRDININKTTIYRSAVIKAYALSVRCVKDHVLESKLRK